MMRRLSPPVLLIVVLAIPLLMLSPLGREWQIAWAPALYILAYTNKQNYRHLIITAVLFILLGFLSWGALFAGCIMIAMLLTEILLTSDADAAPRWARVFAVILFLKTVLLLNLPELSPHISGIAASPPLAAALAAAALAANVYAIRRRRNASTDADTAAGMDVLLVAFITSVLLCYMLTIAFLSVSVDFPHAVLFTTIGLSVLLAITLLLTSPFTREDSSLQNIQHIFSLEVPIDRWVMRISAIAQSEPDADGLTAAVMHEFLALPGISGVSWHTDNEAQQSIGSENRHHLNLHCPPLFIRLHRKRRISPWERLNYYLLARIAVEYCIAKRREELNRADNLSRALHQTGARLTHDIKNILHSLTALTASDRDEQIRKNLPILRERLETTLNKLQTPGDAAGDGGDDDTDTIIRMPAADWWREAQRRHQGQRINFVSDIGGAADDSTPLPVFLFDMALDNFIGNALIKRQLHADLSITVRLFLQNGAPALTVTDNGDAVAPDLAKRLFHSPVPSQTGFGVALYQIQQAASKHRYTPTLHQNHPHQVTFLLRPN